MEGFTYTFMYFFKVSATEGSYVEQYGSDPLNNKGAFIDFSGLKSSGYLELWYETNNELFKRIGGNVNLSPEIPSTPSGPTEGWTGLTYTYSTSTTDPDGDSVRYQFDWGDGISTWTGWYSSGSIASASHSWSSYGTYYVKVRAQDSYGEWSGWSSSLAVSIRTAGGGGCPYVSTWDGTRWWLDNNLIPAAEHSNGTDVIDYYKLQQPLALDEGKYSLLISDVDKHSYIDKVQLLAVDHDHAVNIAVSPYGEILTYRSPKPPQTATTKDGSDIVNLIEKTGDDLYYEGWPDDYLTVDFGQLDITKGAKLLIRADLWPCPVPCKLSIYVQVLTSDGWTDMASFIPRIYWSTDAVDLSAHLPDVNGELKVRLYFTGNHKIDYIGLDTTKQEEFEVRYANLASATHSTHGDVKEALMNSDDQYAELLPSEQVILKFTVPQNTEDTRDFIIIIEGHYYTIET